MTAAAVRALPAQTQSAADLCVTIALVKPRCRGETHEMYKVTETPPSMACTCFRMLTGLRTIAGFRRFEHSSDWIQES